MTVLDDNWPKDAGHASRFLRRATFGPRMADIKNLQKIGLRAWLDAQADMPRIDSHYAYTMRKGPPGRTPREETRPYLYAEESFWYQAAFGEDQLRQRMAFALSQILVVSSNETKLANFPEALSTYMDILYDHALGNYRDLLLEVSKSPAMGVYLTHLRNAKANKKNGRQPDENYAREIMQLFTIGLWQLNPDGTRKRGSDGSAIETYTQDDITGMARVFTGWSFGGGPPTRQRWYGSRKTEENLRRWDVPMIAYKQHHERGKKQLLGGHVIPAGTSAQDSMERAIDVLFNHPNTAPFVSKQLIQRLTQSNPSPGYIERVAAAFDDNGNGVRGDLYAVVKAILLDTQAWQSTARAPQAGKLREPILRMAHWLRTTANYEDMKTIDFALNLHRIARNFGQTPFQAPSVFNWYDPDLAPFGPALQADAAAPEFKLHDDRSMISYVRVLRPCIRVGLFFHDRREALPHQELKILGRKPEELVDWIDLVLCGKTLSRGDRAIILKAVSDIHSKQMPARVHTALHLGMISQAYLIDA